MSAQTIIQDATINGAGFAYLIPSLLEVAQMYQASSNITINGYTAIDGVIVNCSPNLTAQNNANYTFMGLAVLFLIIFSFLMKRASFKKTICHGIPGPLLPMGMLDSHDQIIEFTLAFLSVSEDIYTFIFGVKPEFDQQIPIVKFFLKLLMVLVLSITSYLTFAGLHNRYLIGYLFAGTMSACYSYYDITNTIIYMSCFASTKIIPFICQAIVYCSIDLSLLIIFMYRLIRHILQHGCKMIDIREHLSHDRHFCDQYVKMLLAENEVNLKEKLEENVEDTKNTNAILKLFQCSDLKDKISKKVYKKIPGFTLPPRLIIGISVGLFFAYRIFIDQISSMTPTIWNFVNAINLRYVTTYTNLSSSFQIITSNLSAYQATEVQNSYMFLTLFYIHLLIGCLLTAIVIGFFNSVIHSFLIIRNYRLHFEQLTQRGFSSMIDLKHAPDPYELILGFVRFSGYQAAHILWGILVISMTLTLLLYAVIGFFLLPLFYVNNSYPRTLLLNYGPVLLATFILNFLQTLMVKYVFTKEKGQLMELDNRRAFIIFCHCLFFLNAMMGVFTCLKKVIVWIFSGIVCFCRMDFSSLPDYILGCDTGYMCYIGFLYTEQYHHNPILRSFVNILLDARKPLQTDERGQSNTELGDSLGIEKMSVSKNNYRNKWAVAYTLVNNKSLWLTRKTRPTD